MMSPNSLVKAEALGYTNVKVYREGYPEWLERNVGVIAAPHLKEAWIDKDIPHVLVDARPVVDGRRGRDSRRRLGAAVARCARRVARCRRPKLKAPIMVYDGDNGSSAMQVARVIKDAGQPNVTVIGGGFDAWKSARLQGRHRRAAPPGRLRAEAAPGLDSRRRVRQRSPPPPRPTC